MVTKKFSAGFSDFVQKKVDPHIWKKYLTSHSETCAIDLTHRDALIGEVSINFEGKNRTKFLTQILYFGFLGFFGQKSRISTFFKPKFVGRAKRGRQNHFQ